MAETHLLEIYCVCDTMKWQIITKYYQKKQSIRLNKINNGIVSLIIIF